MGAGIGRGGGSEMEAARESQHGNVFGEDVGDDGMDFFGASDLDEASDKFAVEAEADAFVPVGNEDDWFGFFGPSKRTLIRMATGGVNNAGVPTLCGSAEPAPGEVRCHGRMATLITPSRRSPKSL